MDIVELYQLKTGFLAAIEDEIISQKSRFRHGIIVTGGVLKASVKLRLQYKN